MCSLLLKWINLEQLLVFCLLITFSTQNAFQVFPCLQLWTFLQCFYHSASFSVFFLLLPHYVTSVSTKWFNFCIVDLASYPRTVPSVCAIWTSFNLWSQSPRLKEMVVLVCHATFVVRRSLTESICKHGSLCSCEENVLWVWFVWWYSRAQGRLENIAGCLLLSIESLHTLHTICNIFKQQPA